MSDARHESNERWILKTELLWAFGVGVFIAAALTMIVFTALTISVNPPSNVERIDPKGLNKRQVENLVLAGAFDSINGNRRQVHDSVEQMLRQSAAAHDARDSSQSMMFAEATQVRLNLPPIPDWLPMERLQNEFGAIGFYL